MTGTNSDKTIVLIIGAISVLMTFMGIVFLNHTTAGFALTVSGVVLGYMSYYVYSKKE